MKILKTLFQGQKTPDIAKYKGLSDFFLHAPADEKKKVIKEAAYKSNKDQLDVFRKANLKVGTR